MTGQLLDALKARLPGVPLYAGEKHLDEHAVPPRLVLVPRTDTFDPPDQRQMQPGHALYTRVCGFELHVWGKDLAQVEQMLPEVIGALHLELGTSLRLDSGTWNDPEQAWITKGAAYSLNFAVRVPVIRIERFAVLEQIAQECGGLTQEI